MGGRGRFSRQLAWFGVGGLIALGCPQLAGAECRAKEFSLPKLNAVIAEVNDATANLKALVDAPWGAKTSETSLLTLAMTNADRATAEATMFGGYLLIYDRLVSDADRKATDDFIRDVAPSSWSSLKKYADNLTLIANVNPRYAAEINQARDRIRKLQGLFLCAAA